MHDPNGLLRAVRNDPTDDLPRLAFADWCEENGQMERGELIRVQLELVKALPPRKLYTDCSNFVFYKGSGSVLVYGEAVSVGERIDVIVYQRDVKSDINPGKFRRKSHWYGLVVTDVRYSPSCQENWVEFAVDAGSRPCRSRVLHDRERELLAEHNGARFLADTPLELGHEVAGGGWMPLYKWVFRRGFVAEVVMPVEDFVTHAGAIFAAHPIERVTLQYVRPYMAPKGVPMLPPVEWDAVWYEDVRTSATSPRSGTWDLPPELYRLLPRTRFTFAEFNGDPTTPEDAARDALHDVCLTYGRNEAKKLLTGVES